MKRTETDIATIAVRARLRRERRIRTYMTMSSRVLFDPIAARSLDLVHEATYLVDRLEKLLARRIEIAREEAQERTYAY